MAVKQLPKISNLPEPPDRLVGDQERFDVLTFNSLKAQKKMVNEDLNKTLIPALNQFAVDVNASVDAAKASETLALASKNAAASSAATATTKAGEAAASATAAKASETSALASKNAAGISAATASNAQKAAEAARDEAQDLANVGYASESRAGLAKVDGKTTQAAADGAITVKDVAIGGNLEDLASARGFFYDTYLPYYPGRGSNPVDDFNLLTLPGTYHIVVSRDTLNRPNVSLFTGSGTNDGILEITMISPASTVSSYQRLKQRFTVFGSDTKTWSRNQDTNVTTWYAWEQEIRTGDIGDGIRVTNGIISVPEMQGATISAAGTSGLVPPAAAGQQESFLTGGGEYKPALTKISDSVNLADSKMAASAKAVKAVYDRLEALRVSFLGVPRYWRSTTLPAGHVWANGDLALFSDWPELENLYRSGGLEGMLLSYDVPPSTIAQYCGRWRLNASSPTGLYVPNLSERFINSTINTNAFGTANTAGVPNIVGGWEDLHVPIVEVPAPGQSGAIIANGIAFANSSLSTGGTGYVWNGVNFDASRSSAVYGRSPTVMPASVNYPIIIYLGNHS
ncbi:Phage tail fiber protein [Bilophila wadsworthia]|uniref:hypothetical protein n=1 Tax=Bilophila wadsworthia TaxID=35833 RepID=UPI003D6F65DB